MTFLMFLQYKMKECLDYINLKVCFVSTLVFLASSVIKVKSMQGKIIFEYDLQVKFKTQA